MLIDPLRRALPCLAQWASSGVTVSRTILASPGVKERGVTMEKLRAEAMRPLP